MHVEVTNGLQKEKSALQSETAKLARDLDLLRQAEALHLQRSSSQARCIAENNSKVLGWKNGIIFDIGEQIWYLAMWLSNQI